MKGTRLLDNAEMRRVSDCFDGNAIEAFYDRREYWGTYQ